MSQPPIARDTLVDDLKGDQAKGAVVHTFNPDASPESKAASAGKAAANLTSVNATNGNVAAPKAVTVLGTESSGPPPPTTIGPDATAGTGAIANGTEKGVGEEAPPTEVHDEDQPPGGFTGPAPAIPDWYKVGWRDVSGIDAPIPMGEARDRNIIATFISDQYYGQWYHNAGVIFFAVASTYFLTLFRMGWGWLFIVLAACGTFYTNSMETLRRATRDDIQRELVKTCLESEAESADWINNFLDRFWLIYEPVLSRTIISSVDQIFSISTPPFLDSIRLHTFTLGTKAPRIDKVRTWPRTPDDEVLMDWGISFTSTHLADLPPSQTVGKTNSKIVLEIKIGKGPARITMPILVENIEFNGEMRIKLKLINNFPHVKTVDICFMSKPTFNYVLKPIGGETFGPDINSIPGLQTFIRDMVHATLSPMMYNPNVFTLNLEQLLSGAPVDAATGVLQIKIESARGLKGAKLGGGTPDPYVSISISNRAESTRTKFKRSSYNPHFGSSHNILLNDANMTEALTLNIMDHNDRRKDTLLGTATFELSLLTQDATREGIVSKVLREGKECGEVIYSVSYYPVLTPKTLEGGVLEPVPETQVGIVRLTIHQAKELDTSKSLSNDLNPHAKVLFNRQVIFKTPTYKHTVAPVWELATEFVVTNKDAAVITVKVVDDRDLLKDPVVGYLSVDLDYLLQCKEEQRDWFPLSEAKTGKLRLTAEWKPLAMAGSVQGAAAYVPPIGVVRLCIQKAVDVKNVEATLGGKSDPYVRVVMKGITMARTEVVNNNLNPEWDQIVYVPVHSLQDILTLETMDYQHMTKDRSLGYVEVAVKDLARENVENYEYPFEALTKQSCQTPIRLSGDNYKGTLHYVAEFIPAFNLRGLTFDSKGTEMDQGMGGVESGEDVASDGNSTDTDSGFLPAAHLILGKGTRSKPVTVLHGNGNGNGNGNDNGAAANGKSHSKKKSVDSVAAAALADKADNTSIKTSGTKKTTATTHTGGSAPVVAQTGIELSREELMKNQSGVLIVDAISGILPRKARLELLLDDGYWPSFATERARSQNAHWDQVGEGFVKELDFCAIWLRLNENAEGVKDEIIGEIRMSAITFLEKCWNQESEFELLNDRGDKAATVKLLAKYCPVPVTLEPRESINNMGSLRVDVISASNLRAADRGGKSDPYAVFNLNGQRVFKSEVKKKTLTPVWDQSFSALVPSRVGAHFEVEVFDWDQVGTPDSLGTTLIDLTQLEPLEAKEVVLPLSSQKYGQKGEIKLGFVFTPQIVARTRKSTSTFAVGGRAMTQVVSLPFGATKGIAHGVGGVAAGIGGGAMKAKGLFGGLGSRTKTIDESGPEPEGFSIPVPQLPPKDGSLAPGLPTVPSKTDLQAGQISQPVGLTAATAAMNGSSGPAVNSFPTQNTAAMSGQGSAPRENGTLRVTVCAAKDLSSSGDIKPYVTVKIGRKEHQTKHVAKTVMPEWEECFSFAVGPETETMSLAVFDHKTLGKDKHLGEAEVEIWRHIQLARADPITAADVWVELKEGTGLVQIRLEFEAGNGKLAPSVTSASVSRSPLSSPSRFSTSRRATNASDGH